MPSKDKRKIDPDFEPKHEPEAGYGTEEDVLSFRMYASDEREEAPTAKVKSEEEKPRKKRNVESTESKAGGSGGSTGSGGGGGGEGGGIKSAPWTAPERKRLFEEIYERKSDSKWSEVNFSSLSLHASNNARELIHTPWPDDT